MSRIPYPPLDSLAPEIRASVSASKLNSLRMMANASPPVFVSFTKFASAFFTGSALDPILRQTSILRVCYLSGARYPAFQHEALARKLGFAEGALVAIRGNGEEAILTAAQKAVIAFTTDVVKNVRAGDETLQMVMKYLTTENVVDLILMIGLFMTSARLLETANVDLEASPVDWGDGGRITWPIRDTE
jgi:4-carboxymuconolactone decarboxylase